MSLQQKVTLFVAMGFVLVFGLLGWLGIRAVSDSTNRALAQREAMARIMAVRIDQALGRATSHLDRLAKSDALNLEDTDWEPEKKALREVHQYSGELASVFLLDAQGRVLWTEPYDANLIGSSHPGYFYVEQAWRTGQLPIATALMGEPVVWLGIPLRNKAGQIRGLVGGSLNLALGSSGGFIGPIGLDGTAYAQIINGEGAVVASANPEEAQDLFEVTEHSKHLAALIKARQSGVSPCHRCHQAQGRAQKRADILAFAPLTLASGGVAIRQSEEEVFRPSRELAQQMLLVGLPILFLGLSLAWLGSRSIAKPIARLTAAAQRIGRGDLEHPITSAGGGEVGALACTFEEMRQKLSESLKESEERAKALEERARQLLALNTIASTLSQSLDLDRILGDALDKVLELMGGNIGGVLLLDEKTQTLSYRVSRGLSPEFVRGIKALKLGEGIAGMVAQLGEPIVVDDISRDPRVTRPVVFAEGLRAFASVPVRSKDEVVGVMNITSRTPRHFSAQDMQLLTAIGSQIGVAIENARLYDEVQRAEKTRGELLRQIISAQEEERKRIARELHDETGQALSTLLVSLEALAASLPKGPESDLIKARLEGVKSLVAASLSELRKLVFDLRPSMLDDLGLVVALQAYSERRLGQSGVEVHVETIGAERRLPSQIEVALFRIVQEAMANIAQHADAESASISLEFKDKSVAVHVEDDGKGFDVAGVLASAGVKDKLGLLGMRERAKLMGGTLTIESRPGAGTEVHIEIPVNWEETGNESDSSADS